MFETMTISELEQMLDKARLEFDRLNTKFAQAFQAAQADTGLLEGEDITLWLSLEDARDLVIDLEEEVNKMVRKKKGVDMSHEYIKRNWLNERITRALQRFSTKRLAQLEAYDKDQDKKPSWYREGAGRPDLGTYNGRIVSWYYHYYNKWTIHINYLFVYHFNEGQVSWGLHNPIKEYRKAKRAERIVSRILVQLDREKER